MNQRQKSALFQSELEKEIVARGYNRRDPVAYGAAFDAVAARHPELLEAPPAQTRAQVVNADTDQMSDEERSREIQRLVTELCKEQRWDPVKDYDLAYRLVLKAHPELVGHVPATNVKRINGVQAVPTGPMTPEAQHPPFARRTSDTASADLFAPGAGMASRRAALGA